MVDDDVVWRLLCVNLYDSLHDVVPTLVALLFLDAIAQVVGALLELELGGRLASGGS